MSKYTKVTEPWANGMTQDQVKAKIPPLDPNRWAQCGGGYVLKRAPAVGGKPVGGSRDTVIALEIQINGQRLSK